ncbi:MAG: hypothetical protein J5569_04445 [Oscillospiraceae bacterium]|nr:hypothetical protein [Oscillospiraceae bacterium]
MRKLAFLPPVCALALGAVGFIFRKEVLDTAFDAAGLAVPGSNSAAMLLYLACAAAVVCILFGAIIGGIRRSDPEYVRAFSGGLLNIVVNIVLAAAFIYAGYLLYTQFGGFSGLSILQLLFLIFALLSAIAFIIMSVGAYRRKESGVLSVFSMAPALFFCVWLIMFYKEHSVDPTLLRFAYHCVAFAVTAIAFFIAAGYAVGKSHPAFYIITALLAVFLCTLCAADFIGSLPELILLGATVLELVINTSLFIANLKPRKE